MTQEDMNLYKMRISQAGIAELTLIMMQMEMQWMKEACGAYEDKDMDLFQENVSNAQSVQVELMNVMNVNNSVARDMYSVFVYINKMLIESQIKQHPVDLMRCVGMMEKFYKSIEAISETDTAGPVMESSEKVYAGLTYGASGLVESSVGGHDYSV